VECFRKPAPLPAEVLISGYDFPDVDAGSADARPPSGRPIGENDAGASPHLERFRKEFIGRG
jgi:hypothetical protein